MKIIEKKAPKRIYRKDITIESLLIFSFLFLVVLLQSQFSLFLSMSLGFSPLWIIAAFYIFIYFLLFKENIIDQIFRLGVGEIFIFLFLIFNAFSILYSIDRIQSLERVLTFTATYILFFKCFNFSFKNRSELVLKIPVFLQTIIFIVLAIGLVLRVCNIEIVSIERYVNWTTPFLRYKGIFTHTHGVANVSMIAIVLSLMNFQLHNNKRWFVFNLISLIVAIYSIFLSNARLIILGAFIAIVVLIILLVKRIEWKNRILISIVLSLLLLSTYFFYISHEEFVYSYFRMDQADISSGRGYIFQMALKYFKECPFGYGAGVINRVIDYPLDNSYLIILLETGIFGLLLFLIFLIKNTLGLISLMNKLDRYSKERIIIEGYFALMVGLIIGAFFENLVSAHIDLPSQMVYLAFISGWSIRREINSYRKSAMTRYRSC